MLLLPLTKMNQTKAKELSRARGKLETVAALKQVAVVVVVAEVTEEVEFKLIVISQRSSLLLIVSLALANIRNVKDSRATWLECFN